MGSTILIYNQHTLKIFKYEIEQFRRRLHQSQRAEQFKKFWSSFSPPRRNTDLEVFKVEVDLELNYTFH